MLNPILIISIHYPLSLNNSIIGIERHFTSWMLKKTLPLTFQIHTNVFWFWSKPSRYWFSTIESGRKDLVFFKRLIQLIKINNHRCYYPHRVKSVSRKWAKQVMVPPSTLTRRFLLCVTVKVWPVFVVVLWGRGETQWHSVELDAAHQSQFSVYQYWGHKACTHTRTQRKHTGTDWKTFKHACNGNMYVLNGCHRHTEGRVRLSSV